MNELLAASMTSLASLFDGSMGWAILAVSLAVRLALLPLTLHLARKMLANQAKIKVLQPRVNAIKERLAKKPQEMMAAISELYRENGAYLLDRSSLFGALAQLPVFGLLYKAIDNVSSQTGSFLWIKSLATPDALVTMIILVMTAVSTYYFPSAADAPTFMIFIQVAFTAFIVWKLSAGLGLYWAASSLVGAVQTFVLRFEQRAKTVHVTA